MPSPYLLDTNAYALLFQNPRPVALTKLEALLKSGNEMHFYLPEIVCMEIHSVLGKYRRGGVQEQQSCGRNIFTSGGGMATCSHTCILPKRSKIKPKVYKGFLKLLKDIETEQGSIKARILGLNSSSITQAKDLLYNYAEKYSFGSHDALIAATAIVEKSNGNNLVLVTSDKGLKAVCNEVGLQLFDPAV